MKNKNNFNLIEKYKHSLDFVKESKNFIYLIVGLFFLFSLIGFFIPAPETISKIILKFIKELLLKTQGMDYFELAKFIFFNNIKSSFFGMIFGVFFGFFPFMAILANGYVLGFVASMSVSSKGILVLWRLFPHGIFELPAIFISLGIGLKLGLWAIINPIKFYWEKNKLVSLLFFIFYFPVIIIALVYDKKFKIMMKKSFSEFRINFIKSLEVFLLIVFPLLIVAAIIEAALIYFS